MLKILHTSDVQLDAPFRFLGETGSRHRQQLRKTFRRIVGLAAEGGFDLLLIAGDLFNDNRPRQVTGSAQGKCDGDKPPEAAGALDFGSFFKGRVDVSKARGKAEDDERKHVKRLDKHQSVYPVNEIDRFVDPFQNVHEEKVHGAVFAEKDDERKNAGKGGQDYGQKYEGRKNGLSQVPVPCKNVGQGNPEQSGRKEQERT